MASIISLKPGDIVFCGNVGYEIVEAADSLTSIKVRNVVNGDIRVLSLDDLSSRSSDVEKVPAAPLDCLSPEEREFALKRFAMIKPAIVGHLSRAEIEELAAKNGVHFTTIYRLLRRFSETGSPSSLLLRTCNRGGKGKTRIPKALETIIRDHFDDVVKAGQVDIAKVAVKSLHTDIKAKCRTARLKPPTWSTVNDRLEKYLKEKKLGRDRVRRKKSRRTTAGGMFPDADRPLDVVQIDHTPLDIMLVDDKYRKSIGRAILSLAIDVCSRMILGFSVSLEKPGIFSVGQLIAHCILRKERFLESVGVNARWEAFGLMRTLFMDNAGEFRAADFIPFQEEYFVEISWRPVATPEYGGHIERLARTLNDKIHNEPGSTFSNLDQRGDYDSEGKACYTIDEIEKWLTILITREYHEEEHSELGMSPREKYESVILGEGKPFGGLPSVVEDEERLRLFLLPSFHRTVQRQGVELDKIIYFHDILRHWGDAKDKDGKPRKFMFKRDPRRISPIYFFDPDRNEYFAIPYKDLTRPPMSAWELQASKKRCKEKGIGDANEQQIFEAYQERMKIRENAVARTKQARREQEAEKRRSKDAPIEKTGSGKSTAEAVPAAPPADSMIDIASLYEDASLLDGVIVQQTSREE